MRRIQAFAVSVPCALAAAIAIVAIAATAIATARTAGAGSLEWRFTSLHRYIVQLQFFAQGREHVWPAPDDVWELRDSREHSYTIACTTGEKICYGAWVKNRDQEYWGVGPHDEEACESCCAVCGESPPQAVELTEAGR
jgi:hypothetical protein